MKYLLLILSITALLCGTLAVDISKQSTLDSLKTKARQVYKQLDVDRNGQLSYDELSAGVKKGLGFQPKEEPGFFERLYEKYVASDKEKEERKYFTQEDFEQIFSKFNRGYQSTVGKLQQKASQIYDKFDANHDGQVTLEELGTGLKAGLGFQGQKIQQKSISDYANQLYQKYVKSDKVQNKSFTKQDFYKILEQVQNQPFLQQVKGKAQQIHSSLDKNKDGNISMQEISQGIKSGLGIEGSILEKAKDLYDKYSEQGKQKLKQWGLSYDDISALVLSAFQATKDKATEIKDKVVQNIQTEGTTLNKIKQTATNVKDKILEQLDTEKQDSTINKLKQTATNVKDKVLQQLDTSKQNSTINKIKQTATQVGTIVKDKVIQEMDLQNENSTLSKLKDAAIIVKDKVLQQLDTGKQNSTINKLKDTAVIVGAKVIQQLDLSKQNSTINKVKDAATVVKDKILQQLDLQNDQSTISMLRDKANEVYKRMDKNSDESLTLDEIKEGIKSGLLFGEQKVQQIKDKAEDIKDKAQQKGKQLNQQVNQFYQKYIKHDNRGINSFSKQDFLKIFADETKGRKQKQFLQSTKKKASQFYKKFDTNADGSVSLEELGAGIKQGLGINKNDQSQPNLFTKLYEKYIKSQQEDKKAFSQQDFLNYIRKRQVISRRNACKKADKLNLDQLKAKASRIHDKLDINDDEHISFHEISQGIKSKLGLQSEHEEDENSFLNYLKNYHKEQDTQQQKENVKISKDQFSNMLSSWHKSCPAKKAKFEAEKKQVNEQL